MKFHQEIVTPHTPMPPYPILVILPKKMSPTNFQNITSPTRRETCLLSNDGSSTSGTGPRKQLKRNRKTQPAKAPRKKKSKSSKSESVSARLRGPLKLIKLQCTCNVQPPFD
ncbi:uncharacterized protein LOC115923069 [Strongylocentrotus purpuratus]|uniref:Uncharacterized protein n=1 Tax=Strongylocentrotus purpuratus TaxID=7668 RepID=A0A7M7SXR9_STRPU|nr:uncharacterized protein LOC115923069 [Strongylocentrotus purpuratus]